jgi:ATP-dependent exoDNAse (exonuclease V) beta subunit
MEHIEFISAGAGSGKTYSLTQRLKDELKSGAISPPGVIATTFTRKAAAELKERVREALMDAGMVSVANQMSQSLISTVNGMCGLLLERFSFEAGFSPELSVLEESQAKRLLHEAVDEVLGEDISTIQRLNSLSYRLGIVDNNGQLLWRGQIADIVNAARENNCDPAALPSFAKNSSDELLSHFRKPVQRDLDAELHKAISQALAEIDLDVDKTGTTKTYVESLRKALRPLENNNLSWPEWIGLSKKSPGAKSRLAAEPVQLLASDYEVHPQLHANILDYTTLLFEIAAACMNTYQSLKQRQGLIDFIDQELQVYNLLAHPAVKETLADELELLMVDEFQDTSPIQLALFSRLAVLADKVIWVGDIKQAIYGFRGSDPELMQAVVDKVSTSGGATSVLEKSWRSRPALVKYCNAIFEAAFSNTLDPQKVVLSPARDEVLPEFPAVTQLELSGNKGDQLDSIATAIRLMVKDEYKVVDKKSGEPRAIRYGDIAVLCRSHGRLADLASACSNVGVAVSYQRPGLLATPECVLALSCLRRVFDKHDTLASAQIRSLVCTESVESWLSERLNYLQAGEPSSEWGESEENGVPELQALAAIRGVLKALTPLEALSESIAAAGVRQTVIGWGPSAQHARVRLANLDCLLGFVREYESTSETQHLAATVPGLLQWLDNLVKEKQDLQAVTADNETVQLLTYHGAKGLEWPVVLCHDLDFEPRNRLWGLKAVSSGGKLDIDNPLQNRILRFYPAFFGKNAKDVPVKDRVEESPIGEAAILSALEEEKRLLYVAFTRARDCLVLPKGKKSALSDILNASWLFPESDSLTLPSGSDIPARSYGCTPQEFELADTYQPQYFQREQYAGTLLPKTISPSARPGRELAVVLQTVELGDRISLHSSVEMADLGSAFHAILAADITYKAGIDVAAAKDVLARYGVLEAVDPEEVLRAGRALIEHLRQEHNIVALYPEFPIQLRNEDGQEISGFIDLLVETDNGFLIVDHKSAPGGRSQWQQVAQKYSGQLACYKESIEKLSKRPVLGCWLHLVVGGALLEVA